ncbi:MAG: CocE/NonD family hydrolase [Candidatus Aminicenantes bacterium]|nr:CocE/NonD family hydrolase [Candidatus Aminicenantes bacterium]
MNIPQAIRKTVLMALGAILFATSIGPVLSEPAGIPEPGQSPRLSIREVLLKTIHESGVVEAIRQYRRLKSESPDAYDFAEGRLNELGLDLLDEDRVKDAIEVFKLNVEAYPNAWNTYDSLGYAYMIDGRKDLAIPNYKKSVELNPENEAGRRYAHVLEHYDKKEYLVPMRDGVKLFTQIYSPRDRSRTYPIMFRRTPYGIPPYGETVFRPSLGPSWLFTAEGYIFVYQDCRGQFRSEGEFVVMRPHQPKKKSPLDTDESSDTYDTIEWLLANIPNHNGRVGQWGVSYSGWHTVMGMIDAHPALKASSPQASPADMWVGDDFHHNGAFRLMYTFDWLAGSAQVRNGPSAASAGRFRYGTPDGYRFFLELGPILNVDRAYFHEAVPTWNDYMAHGDYDEYWKRQNVLPHLKNIRHPVLNVAGWFDAEDFFGPMSIYRELEANNPANRSTLVVGPWSHGGWTSMDGDVLGNIRFGVKTGIEYREKIELPFFNFYLKDKGTLELPEALVFETGSNRWVSHDRWPPRGTEGRMIYLREGGRLSFEPPSDPADRAADKFTSDPAKPVPWSTEIRTTQGHLWMVEDQRFAARRPDVLVYQSDVLADDITIAGPIIASLYVSTTGTDADWIVKLIDVYPSDSPDPRPNPTGVRMGDLQMLLAGEVFRGKYRTSFEKPEPLTPNAVTPIEFDLRDRYHRFLKGHRIMVQIQSTWFPLIDRNPQTFVDIYRAREEDFRSAVHTVYRSRLHPSNLKLAVIAE